MAIETPPTLTPTPLPAPQRGEKSTFANRVDAFITWLTTAVMQFYMSSLNVAHNALEAYNSAVAAAGSALQAQTAATNSVAAVDLVATSTDTRTLSAAAITFNVQPNKGFAPGMMIVASPTMSTGNRFIGRVATYDKVTGILLMGAETFVGSGTFSAWTITISGPYVTPFAAGGAYADYALAADRVLNSASARLQSVSPTVSGLDFDLPNATTLVLGQAQFTLTNAVQPASLNAVANDIGVSQVGVLLKGFVLPGESVRANLVENATVGGVWSFENLSPIGVRARRIANASTVIGGTAGMFVKAFPLDADRIMLLLHGVSLHAVIYNQTTNQWGGVVLLRTAFATAGAVDNVMAVPTATPGQLLVFSVGEGQTAGMAMVVWGGSAGNVITPGAATAVTLGGACNRLVDLIAVGTSYVLGFMVGTTSIRFRALTTVSDIPAAGAETALATVAPPALLPIDSTRFAVMTASATVLTITPYAVAATVSTVGTPATAPVTSASNITVKPGAFTTYQRWIIAYMNSSGFRVTVALVTFSGASPVATIGPSANASPNLTTVSGVATVGYLATMATAVYGTLASGEFGVEFFSFIDTGTTLSTNTSTDTFRATSAAVASVAPLAVDLTGADGVGTGSGVHVNWQVATAKEVSVFACKEVVSFGNFFFASLASRKGAIPGSLALPVPAIYPKASLPGGTLTVPNTSRSVSLGDGSKPPLYCANAPIGLRALSTDLLIPGDTANAAQGFDTSSIWMGYSQGPNLAFYLLQVRLA